jgi:hypothetical protein
MEREDPNDIFAWVYIYKEEREREMSDPGLYMRWWDVNSVREKREERCGFGAFF